MRILFICRSTLYSQPGGDTIQVEQTALFLQKLGVEVVINYTGFKKDFRSFDVLHFFNLMRPADVLPYLNKNSPPLVCTSIFIDYSKVAHTAVQSASTRLLKKLRPNTQEYVKAIARGFKGSDQMPSIKYILAGHKTSVKKVLKATNHLIVASKAELGLIKDNFGFNGAHSFVALGTEHFTPSPAALKENRVLCVARFEALKNQLTLIKAQQQLNVPMTLVGNAAANQQAYLQTCKKLASPLVSFKSYTNGESLQTLYGTHKVHALPSYYETTGLATLEALLSGAQVVCGTGGAQKELFKEIAFFCNPEDTNSVANAIKRAMLSNENHQNWVKENFSWQVAAEKLHTIYKRILA